MLHQGSPRRHRRRVAPILLSLVALLLWAATPAAPAPAHAQAPPASPLGTVTFEYTGAAQSWTVPAGVSQATFDVYGAQGGDFPGHHSGGRGGQATATLTVAPGSVVTIYVGSAGGDAGQCSDLPTAGGAGGFNGGGNGAPNGGGACPGAGGGGASDVRVGGAFLSNRVLVAGGGGGASKWGNDCGPGDGAPGGGLTGGSAPCGGSGGNQDGTSGSGMLGGGGAGAEGTFGGGGGGGGYYGGAGAPAQGGGGNYGGGGGSGFGPLGTIFQTGARAGNGTVVVTFIAGTPPMVTSIAPAGGPATGGTVVTITGAGFSTTPGATIVTFGGLPATNVSCSSTTQCTATSPASQPPPGPVNLVVQTPGGLSNAVSYTYFPPPTVTSIAPAVGPATGGTVVTITGDNLVSPFGPTVVAFGSAPAINVSCDVLGTSCTATSPAGSGTVSVRVTTNGQTSADTPADDFTYQGAPTITGIAPTSGTTAGGTTVVFTGTGFSTTPGATAVAFGGVPARSVDCATTTTCAAVSPPGTGTVSVRVTVAGQTSPDTPADDFTYRAPPTVTGLRPTRGPAAGGQYVTISGTGLSTVRGGTVVTFGTVASADVGCPSSTQCTALSPPGTGTVSVRVTVGSLTSADTSADDYTYLAAPAITSISPTSGPPAGGTRVTITGTGFSTNRSSIGAAFGTVTTTDISCSSTTQCIVVSPPGTGTVSVTVTVNGLFSADTSADDFTYTTAGGPMPQPLPTPEVVVQLTALEAAVQGAGAAGPGLVTMVRGTRQAVEAGQPIAACGLLRGFLATVGALDAAGQLTQSQVLQFTADAARIRTTLNCS